MKLVVLVTLLNIALVPSLSDVVKPQRIFHSVLDSNETKPSPRIYGGTKAKAGQFPYVVFVVVKVDDLVGFCTGSLIRPDLVMTAAHCLLYHSLSIDDAYVAAGAVDVLKYFKKRQDEFDAKLSENEFNVKESKVKKFIRHPFYSSSDPTFDIAVLHLEKPLNGTNIAVIPLYKDQVTESKSCTIVGFGTKGSEKFTGALNYADDVQVYTSDFDCLDMPLEPVLCVKSKSKGTCPGDSGSPLICDGEAVGVAAYYSSISGDCREVETEYYTELYPFLDWVLKGGSESFVTNFSSFVVCVAVSLWVSFRF